MADDRREHQEQLLKLQRDAFTASRPESMAVRKDRIKRAMTLLKENAEAFGKAMSDDFGSRSMMQSMITDIGSTLNAGKHALKNMDKWAKTEKRPVQFPLGLLGAT